MKIVLVFLIILLLIPVAHAQGDNNLYQHDALELKLNLEGGFDLVGTRMDAIVSEITAEVLLYPQNDFRQTIQNWQSAGKIKDNSVFFTWNDNIVEAKNFSYTAGIKTVNERKRVERKINFPLSPNDISGLEQYLDPTITIDSDNPKIIAKATELAEGEDDLFKVAFKLASWVEENVKYDLNTLTATSSQKASWVLENRQGVCDEMTSLFVAMARSVGIPARFVSGISYTTSELFDENWQPHGWAEAYFPGIGWVSFDITFGEYGYIDVTHVKLRDGFDPAESATKYEWLSNNVQLQAEPLDFNMQIAKKGTLVPEEILLEQEILAPEVDFGSYNLIKGILKNQANYYAATTLYLAAPRDLEIQGRNKRTILLEPKEVKETFWILKVRENLDRNYWYEFPLVISTEKNVSVTDSFNAQQGMSSYSQSEIEKLTIQDEEKSYSRKISFNCDLPEEIASKEETAVTCSIKNSGNANLERINFCLDGVCELFNLPINQRKESSIKIKAEDIGWNKLIVTAENSVIEKRTSFNYKVLDAPNLTVSVVTPETAIYGQSIPLEINVEKNSFSVPQEVIISLSGQGIVQHWELDKVEQKQILRLDLIRARLTGKNTFTLVTTWQDNEGQEFSQKQEFTINAKGNTLISKMKMLFNRILNLFS